MPFKNWGWPLALQCSKLLTAIYKWWLLLSRIFFNISLEYFGKFLLKHSNMLLLSSSLNSSSEMYKLCSFDTFSREKKSLDSLFFKFCLFLKDILLIFCLVDRICLLQNENQCQGEYFAGEYGSFIAAEIISFLFAHFWLNIHPYQLLTRLRAVTGDCQAWVNIL